MGYSTSRPRRCGMTCSEELPPVTLIHRDILWAWCQQLKISTKDAAAILLDEENKRPCRKFLLTGQCDFGSNCRFSHMSEQDLQELSIQVEEERRAREWPLETPELPEGHLEDWLEKRAKRLSSASSSRVEPLRATIFQYPVGWPPVQELPPSLRAPPPGGWPLQPRVQWG
ncbi:zinc finger matrin-type protein 5 isoform X2 [Heterocephalus glaber]|uniref:Zinc finger matrin-type protein 5 isoform X2 n=1 Tax=Heterocephalus glaber TaxID=10181 RepID=A0AAX6SWX5_HETGA|nr:zinc finger matrin-type protein 5 isoform X2 [Heterocephalus glaber]